MSERRRCSCDVIILPGTLQQVHDTSAETARLAAESRGWCKPLHKRVKQPLNLGMVIPKSASDSDSEPTLEELREKLELYLGNMRIYGEGKMMAMTARRVEELKKEIAEREGKTPMDTD